MRRFFLDVLTLAAVVLVGLSAWLWARSWRAPDIITGVGYPGPRVSHGIRAVSDEGRWELFLGRATISQSPEPTTYPPGWQQIRHYSLVHERKSWTPKTLDLWVASPPWQAGRFLAGVGRHEWTSVSGDRTATQTAGGVAIGTPYWFLVAAAAMLPASRVLLRRRRTRLAASGRGPVPRPVAMRQRLSQLLTAGSAVAFAAVATFWVASYHTQHGCRVDFNGETMPGDRPGEWWPVHAHYTFAVNRGALNFLYLRDVEERATDRGHGIPETSFYRTEDKPTLFPFAVPDPYDVKLHAVGFLFCAETVRFPPVNMPAANGRRATETSAMRRRQRWGQVPLWLPAIAAGAMPAVMLVRHVRAIRRRRRNAAGQCVSCGYDLRASRDRCPECGAPVAPAAGPVVSPPAAPILPSR